MNQYLAQITNPALKGPLSGEGGPETGGQALGKILSNLISGFIIFGFIMAFLYLITGAFNWITSGGDKAKLESARDRIIQALVGLLVVAAIWAIMVLVGQFLGLDITNLPIPTVEQ